MATLYTASAVNTCRSWRHYKNWLIFTIINKHLCHLALFSKPMILWRRIMVCMQSKHLVHELILPAWQPRQACLFCKSLYKHVINGGLSFHPIQMVLDFMCVVYNTCTLTLVEWWAFLSNGSWLYVPSEIHNTCTGILQILLGDRGIILSRFGQSSDQAVDASDMILQRISPSSWWSYSR
jgi:hypothetical protein